MEVSGPIWGNIITDVQGLTWFCKIPNKFRKFTPCPEIISHRKTLNSYYNTVVDSSGIYPKDVVISCNSALGSLHTKTLAGWLVGWLTDWLTDWLSIILITRQGPHKQWHDDLKMKAYTLTALLRISCGLGRKSSTCHCGNSTSKRCSFTWTV